MKNAMFFPDLKPSQADYPQCSDMMSRITDLAPDNSNTNAAINVLADGTYHSIIKITALCGRFQAEAKAFSLLTSLSQAQKNMFGVLAEWKKGRFTNEN